MVFSLTLLAAAGQDSKCRRVSLVWLAILLAAALSGPAGTTALAASGMAAAGVAALELAAAQLAAAGAVISGVVWVSRAGLCGGADAIGIAALLLHHGEYVLVWVAAGCMVTALGAILTGESRPPLFPGLLIAHALALWGGAV
jgi:hypothetical protein